MKKYYLLAAFIWGTANILSTVAAPKPLFDGKSLNGWESSDPGIWRVEEGAIVAGDGVKKLPRNYFLFTAKSYQDFEFRCDFKLTGDPKTGLINSGIQFRSEKIAHGHARGYQADIGDASWWGCIYDEHRRNKVIAKSDMTKINPVLKRNDWNTYVIRCEGPRSRLYINEVLTVDFVEKDAKIPLKGRFAVQVHSGGAAKVAFRNITIEEFKMPESPLTPAQQLQTFRVPDGYSVELVASEETGLPKPIKVRFDASGRMWSITATEYPVDGNETPAQAAALWKNGGKDRVVIFDEPLKEGPHTPRTFADGLAMPMAVLPYKQGALVGHGPEILYLKDSDGDGKADAREVLVKGFGVQDSHLLPHQFNFGPGGWVYMAQGAFNRSKVVAGEQAPVSFDYCKLGRFQPDGSKFEVVGYGLNNIWGISHGREGEWFIQEANDMSYSVAPFQVGSSYPGIGGQRFKPYAPLVPPLANFRMGGTGLSGLALSDSRSGTYPDPWHDVMFVANPITRTINAVKISPDAERGYQMKKLSDFLTCSDPWFRPIAITFGPDGCLYIVDWYNKIVSHNEVPRKHPARDKTRGRIWRIRHDSQTTRAVPDLKRAVDKQLVEFLSSDTTWAMKAAWNQIVQRERFTAVVELTALVGNEKARADARIHGLWALDSRGLVSAKLAKSLAFSTNRNIRREAAALRSISSGVSFVDDPDAQVRAQAIRTLARNPGANLGELLRFAKPEISGQQNGKIPWGGKLGKPYPPGAPYNRAFERYLVRAALETCPEKVTAWLAAPEARAVPAENRLFAVLALPPAQAGAAVVRLWPEMSRDPSDEELLVLLQASKDPAVRPMVVKLFTDPAKAPGLISSTVRLRDRLGAVPVNEIIASAMASMNDAKHDALVIQIASEFKLASLESRLLKIIGQGSQESVVVSAVHALGEIGKGGALLDLMKGARPGVQRAALEVVGASGDRSKYSGVFNLFHQASEAEQKKLLTNWSRSRNGASLILEGVQTERIKPSRIEAETLARMRRLIPDSKAMDSLWAAVADQFSRALVMGGKASDYGDTHINLTGAFTVETWVFLDKGISNADGILGRPGSADLNFFGETFRFYGGPKVGDLVEASTKMTPEAWTHLAVTRSVSGDFKIFINGELNATGKKRNKADFKDLQVGRTTPLDKGTAGKLMEFRVWNEARSPDQIREFSGRSLKGSSVLPKTLVYYQAAGSEKPHGGARIEPLLEAPRLMDDATAKAVQTRINTLKVSALKEGNLESGKALFTGLCMSCHTVNGKGGAAAPPLDGSGHRELNALLHAIVAPSAAVEPGYRAFRVETKAGQLAEGFLVKQDGNGTTLRFMGGANVFFPKADIRKAGFTDKSFMVEGLLDTMPEQQVSDLFTYIRSLKN